MNLLVLLCDQLQANVIGPYGGAVPTPTWDRLAKDGVVFDRFYCASPLCVPARASMLTGSWPHTHGSTSWGAGYNKLKEDQELLTDRLWNAGYSVAYDGIWHVDGTGEYTHFVDGNFPYIEHEQALREQGGQEGAQYRRLTLRTDDGFKETRFTIPVPARWTKPTIEHPDMQRAQRVAKFIRGASAAKPFAAWCSLAGPHPPLLVPEPYFSLFKAADMTPPPGFGEDTSRMPLHIREAPGYLAVQDWDWAKWSAGIAAYLGYCAFVDACHGVVLDALTEAGHLDDTAVVFLADHGEMIGAHNLYQKSVHYERSTRIPFILRAPGIMPGRRATLASQIDLVPTVLDLLGLPAVRGAQGRSLVTGAERDSVCVEFNGNLCGGDKWRAIIERRFKYVYHAGDVDQLFDLESDPDELHDLLGNPQFTDVARRLRKKLTAWQDETGDFLPRLQNP